MGHLPTYVYLTFTATAILGIWLFFKAAHHSKSFLFVLLGLVGVQSTLAIAGFYNDSLTATARFPLLLIPSVLLLLTLFFTKSGSAFLYRLDLPTLTMFHTIRIPVELVLFWLYLRGAVPEAMTFHGSNFDILSGVSAPAIYYFGFVKKTLGKRFMIGWNLVCLALLLNVVLTAVLSLPARFSHFGFEQPNIALGYFPFVLLPAVLVPLVIVATVAAVKQLLKK